MTDRELKKLKRADLLELLLAEASENERLRAELDAANKALADRRIAINKAGSIAEASLQLSGIFQSAQDAATRYVENVQAQTGRQGAVSGQSSPSSSDSLEDTQEFLARHAHAKHVAPNSAGATNAAGKSCGGTTHHTQTRHTSNGTGTAGASVDHTAYRRISHEKGRL